MLKVSLYSPAGGYLCDLNFVHLFRVYKDMQSRIFILRMLFLHYHGEREKLNACKNNQLYNNGYYTLKYNTHSNAYICMEASGLLLAVQLIPTVQV